MAGARFDKARVAPPAVQSAGQVAAATSSALHLRLHALRQLLLELLVVRLVVDAQRVVTGEGAQRRDRRRPGDRRSGDVLGASSPYRRPIETLLGHSLLERVQSSNRECCRTPNVQTPQGGAPGPAPHPTLVG